MSPSPSMENGRAESDVGNKSCKNNKKNTLDQIIWFNGFDCKLRLNIVHKQIKERKRVRIKEK